MFGISRMWMAVTRAVSGGEPVVGNAFNITIDHTKVDEDLYDFPLLVNLGSSSGIDSFDSTKIFDNIDIGGLDDKFTGTNGDQPNSTLWLSQDPLVSTIQSNKLRMNITDVDTGTLFNKSIYGNYRAQGDFDIQIDYSNQVSDSNFNNLALLRVDFYEGVGGAYQGYVYVGRLAESYYHVRSTLDGSTSIITADTEGRVRITRVGTVIKCYYWSGTQWEWDGNPSGWTATIAYSGEVRPRISVTKYEIVTASCDFDNYTIIANSIRWTTEGVNDASIINAIYVNPADTVVEQPEKLGFDLVNRTGNMVLSNNDTTVESILHLWRTAYSKASMGSGDTCYIEIYIDANVISNNVMIGFVEDLTTLESYPCTTNEPNNAGIYQQGNSSCMIWSNSATRLGLTLPAPWVTGDTIGVVFQFDGMILKTYHNNTLYDTIDLTSDLSLNLTQYTGRASAFVAMNETTSTFTLRVIESDFTYQVPNGASGLGSPDTPDDTTMYSRKCYTEIDRWDQANQEAQLWVKVPYISKDVDTVINLSFDITNDDNSDYIGGTGELPAQAVWGDYGAVYHLSSDATDSTANALDGTLINMDAGNIVDFGVGKGLSFDGVEEYIDLPDLNHGSLGEMTFEVIAMSDTDARMSMFGINDGGSGDPLVINRLNESSVVGDVVFHVNHGSTNPDVTISGVDTKLLHAYCLTNIEDGIVTAYIDDNAGIDSASGSGGYLQYATDKNNNIGSTRNNALYMEGKLKEIRFAKNIKSPNYIATNYESTQDSLTTFSYADPYIFTSYHDTVMSMAPTAYWRLGEDSGVVAVDEIGNYDGTYEGSPTLGQTGLLVNDNSTSVSFDGVSDYVNLNSVSATVVGHSEMSVCLLINTAHYPSAENSEILFSAHSSSDVNIIRTSVTQTGNLFYTTDNLSTATTTTLDLPDSATHHIVMTYASSGEVTIYVNGVFIESSNLTVPDFANIAKFSLCQEYDPTDLDSDHYEGIMDEFIIFPTILTQEQITELYQASI